MFSHVMVGVSDLERSRKFYDAFLGGLGAAPGVANKNRFFWRNAGSTFGITTPINGEPASVGNGSTLGFSAQSEEQVNACHALAVANGGIPIEDPPGYRGEGPGRMYLAYVRDPDGNKLCLMYRPPKQAS
ncbi:hypothetical protein SDC9_80996 [bioreactor metagenome]|uniref:VOC domain-containing protein n=1 Tax=bioreactor metagenome TaxID=1076179 RepID=A0A644Z6S0_9ZZZZ